LTSDIECDNINTGLNMEKYMWKSDLEILVENDMASKGYDPKLITSIREYWEAYFNGY